MTVQQETLCLFSLLKTIPGDYKRSAVKREKQKHGHQLGQVLIYRKEQQLKIRKKLTIVHVCVIVDKESVFRKVKALRGQPV